MEGQDKTNFDKIDGQRSSESRRYRGSHVNETMRLYQRSHPTYKTTYPEKCGSTMHRSGSGPEALPSRLHQWERKSPIDGLDKSFVGFPSLLFGATLSTSIRNPIHMTPLPIVHVSSSTRDDRGGRGAPGRSMTGGPGTTTHGRRLCRFAADCWSASSHSRHKASLLCFADVAQFKLVQRLTPRFRPFF